MRSKPCSKTNLTILASSKIPVKISLGKVSRVRANQVRTSQATRGKTALGSSPAKAAKSSSKVGKGQTKGNPGRCQASPTKAGSQP